jgi:Inner membrane protein YgaP-like, transmembrane domain
MTRNMGVIDQYIRIVAGLALVAFAFQNGLAIEGWHWLGLIGFVFLVTAFFRSCPLYSALGLSTCERQIGRS